jgi:hypothetical protein
LIRVRLPYQLTKLAKTGDEVELHVEPPVTLRRVLDALEREYPPLRGTTRDYLTGRRRAMIRFYACGSDLSDADLDAELPTEVVEGREALRIVGAIAGG